MANYSMKASEIFQLIFLLVALWASQVTADLCAGNMCSSFSSNQLRGCDSQGCGHYGAPRGSRQHRGTDIKCNGGDNAYAPFPGRLERKARPYGDGRCCDTGYVLSGSGQWSGYKVMVFYTEPDSGKIGRNVAQGERIGRHTGLHCGCYSTTMTDHAHFQLYRSGSIIDSTNFITCN